MQQDVQTVPQKLKGNKYQDSLLIHISANSRYNIIGFSIIYYGVNQDIMYVFNFKNNIFY